jgi:hypothetical protein
VLGSIREIGEDIWECVKEMTPERKRSLFGDADYDWDHEVNTTSGGVSQRTRLLAALAGAPYQPTQPGVFREMIEALQLDASHFVFIDVGSGKGRTLLLAAEFPFRRMIGVELLPELHLIANANASKSEHRDRTECFCVDARDYVFPADPLVLYLFNPLPPAALEQVIANLHRSWIEKPREIRVVYHNPISENVLAGTGWLKKICSTSQYAIYSN